MPTYCNELVVGGQVKFSLKNDTVTDPSHIMAGYVGHLADGRQVTGTGQGGPSATQHTIHFEFTDETDADIFVFYNDSFIGSAITATAPETYDGKTVETAALDNVVWYTKPTVIWETYFDGTYQFYPDEGGSYLWISELGQYDMVFGDTYRITLDGIVYELPCTYYTNEWGQSVCIGDDTYTEYPFFIICYPGDAWIFGLNTAATTHAIKIEHATPSN